MSVFDAMTMMKTYLRNCPTQEMKDSAKQDFIDAINEISNRGYTWGRQHQLPFEVDDVRTFSEKDLRKLANMLRNA